jgi:hypothetical protein
MTVTCSFTGHSRAKEGEVAGQCLMVCVRGGVATYIHACGHGRAGPWEPVVRGRADGWIGWTTTGCVALLAVIAGTVSYLHMH